MDKILQMIVQWIEYFKKQDDKTEKRLDNIENYLTNMNTRENDDRILELIQRLEKLESKEGEEDDRTINEDVE